MKLVPTLHVLLLSLTGFAAMQAQPVNDDCGEAVPIGSVTDYAFTTVNATTDGPDHPNDCVGSGSTGEVLFHDVWYLFTATFTGTAALSLCGTANFDTKIAVYSPGFSCPPLDDQLLACNEDGPGCASYTSFTTFPVNIGATYLLRLGGWGDGATGETGSGTFSVGEYNPLPGPPNDHCADAEELLLDDNDSTYITFTTLNADTDGPLHEPASCFDAGEETVYSDIWYYWNAPFSGWVEWSNCGTASFDSRMAVYGYSQYCQPDPDSLVGCSDDGVDPFNINCPGYTSRAVFEVYEGGHYLFRLGGWSDSDVGSGTFTFKKVPTPVPPPNDLCSLADSVFVMTEQQADDFDYVFEGYNYNGTYDGFPPPQCLNFGEFYDVWYRFNSGYNENIELRFSVLSSASEFLIDLFQDCGTQIDTFGVGFCINTEDIPTDYFSVMLDGFPGEPTEYFLRVTTKITFFPPGEFLFQLVGQPYDPTGTTHPESPSWVLYPNPAGAEAYVRSLSESSGETAITIINPWGQRILSRYLTTEGNGIPEGRIDLADLIPGIYFVVFSDGERSEIQRLVKQ